jgi:hypothetical protein
MTDPNEPLEEKVKRLEAEAEALRKQLADERAAREQVSADRDKYKEQFQMVAHDLARKEWEGFTQEELDEVMRNPVTLGSLLDKWESELRNG